MFDVDTLSENHCFLCARALDTDSRSDEHVFPKWLLRDVDLWNEAAYQLNGTLLPYRQCVIPCCRSCNSGPLALLEGDVERGFSAGMVRLTLERLSLWTAKIYYGNLRRSHSLPSDRRDPSRGPIVPAKALATVSRLRFFLQRIRIDHSFNFDPDSTFVCKLHRYNEPKRNFDWFASTVVGKSGRERFTPGFALRHNGIGIISVFGDGDGGAQRSLGSAVFDEFNDVELHPVQFAELACRAFYQHSLFTDCIGYESMGGHDGSMVTIARFPSHGAVWNDGDDEEYAMYLLKHLMAKPYSGVNAFSDVFSNGQVVTFLYNSDGTRRTPTAEELR